MILSNLPKEKTSYGPRTSPDCSKSRTTHSLQRLLQHCPCLRPGKNNPPAEKPRGISSLRSADLVRRVMFSPMTGGSPAIGRGERKSLQWPRPLRSLASRGDTLCRVRVKTGAGGDGRAAVGLVAALNLLFEFHPIFGQLEDVCKWILHMKEGETMVVSCVLKLHTLLCNLMGAAIWDFMSVIRSMNSEAVVVDKQEGNMTVTVSRGSAMLLRSGF